MRFAAAFSAKGRGEAGQTVVFVGEGRVDSPHNPLPILAPGTGESLAIWRYLAKEKRGHGRVCNGTG